MLSLDSDIKDVVGNKACIFQSIGINKIEDLLFYFPRNYSDRTKVKNICDVNDGEELCIKAYCASNFVEYTRGNKKIIKIEVQDGSGTAGITWFNSSYIKNIIRPKTEYVFFGQARRTLFGVEFVNPQFESIAAIKSTRRIVPIYPLTAKITQYHILNAIERCLNDKGLKLDEPFSDEFLSKHNLVGIDFAIRNIHCPQNFSCLDRAKRRLIFEEFLLRQIAFGYMKDQQKTMKAAVFSDIKCLNQFETNLKFQLTGAQKKTIQEICLNLTLDRPMNRLLQGDVGSGKTIVAAAAMFVAYKNEFQCAFMAPTEILAMQHFENMKDIFAPYDVNIVFISGSQATKAKKENLNKIKDGTAQIVIGTHALISDSVEFANLGLVITDEQHKFGVKQRCSIQKKGTSVHSLIMTATPIPRTLSLILHGDLDISVIDEFPPGRKEIKTYCVNEKMRSRIDNFISKNIEQGGQVYIVCPLVEKSEHFDYVAASEHFKILTNKFPNYSLALIHGKLKKAEQEDIMRRFANKEFDILLSTTIIEVGVDVPNANVMIIENAERFGLSQLHQLRGRVGRGQKASFCIMFTESNTAIVKERMKIICKTNDGFEIAKQDLNLRGPGEFFGTLQHGCVDMKIADFFKDFVILQETIMPAKEIIVCDSALLQPQNAIIKSKIKKLFSDIDENLTLN